MRAWPRPQTATTTTGAADLRFDAQHIILTVPASFDEVARELTLEAAREAGMAHAVLLEEPLAAFYAWLARHEVDWQQRMRDGQIILVCDVGGGTTDFTLVGVRAGAAGLRFDRLAVGEHLMLGGDNMDYTLGRTLEARLFERPGALDAQRWHQLVYQCRSAKETLLGDDGDCARPGGGRGHGRGQCADRRHAQRNPHPRRGAAADPGRLLPAYCAGRHARRVAPQPGSPSWACPMCRSRPSRAIWPRSGAASRSCCDARCGRDAGLPGLCAL